jgi:transcriptional regulator with XRE-family HTH domain
MEKTLGIILRDFRRQKGMLIREVAAEIKIDSALLSKYETDARLPTKEHVASLIKFYDDNSNVITIAYLSDKVVFELKDEDLALKVISVAENKIKYGKPGK